MTNITQYIVYAHALLHYIKHLKIMHNPLTEEFLGNLFTPGVEDGRRHNGHFRKAPKSQL